MSRKLFTLLLLLAIVTGTVNAQRGKRTIKRIDREVQEAVFIPKGTWMAEVPYRIPSMTRVT